MTRQSRPPLAPLVLLLVVAAGCRNDHCSGVATCFGASASQCQDVPGCAATPGCVGNPINGSDCLRPTAELDCLNVDGCSWNGTACFESCTLIADRTTCEAEPRCLWSACTGKPRPCASYDSDSCPISPLGCYVEPGPQIGE